MRASLFIVFFFSAGIFCGYYSLLPSAMNDSALSIYALNLLLFLVGIGIGSNNTAWDMIKKNNAGILLVPLSVIVGTLLGAALLSFWLTGITLRDSLAVVSGFGYYSLSSIIITRLEGEALGVLALLSNIFREISTLLLTPLLVKYFGHLAPIASGGATSMDTTLPVIIRFTGKEYGIISIFSGIVLTLVAPFLITFILA
ncbi:MAG: lysine exporter LysO family protein [Desulfobacteraceae bacterium]|nr:MAG: lysine exporter LysO family protein [Desulfobacteraceae bacterium]